MATHGLMWIPRSASLLLAVSLGARAQFTPAPGSPFPAGSGPNSVAVADFNGDGNPDLAIANYLDGTVTVLLGDGTGGFTAARGSPFPAGSNPINLAVGDFNGDGKPDLAIANPPSNTVTVLLGNGTGGFTAAPGSPFPAGSDPISLAVGDFNGDGKLDLAIADFAWANVADSAVTLLLGNGSGGFTAAPGSPFAAGYYPDALAVGDFNGDGKPDLAVGGYGGPLTVLLGDGKGGLTANLPTTAGLTPWSVAVGDFNGDGKPDVVVGDRDGYLTLLLGDGTGGFTATPGSPLGVGGRPASLAVADFNADGQMDLAIADYDRTYPFRDTVVVLVGDGAGGFTAAPGSPFVLGTDLDPTSVAVGDFNGDGKPDLAIANYLSNNVIVFLNSNPNPPLLTLISPSNLATGVPLTPVLSWSASSGATSYDVYFGTSSPPPLVTNTAETSYAPGMLGAGAVYFWRVVAKNSGGSNTSATWSFTTQRSAPSAPTLSAPASGATGVSLTPTLSWNASAGATSYDVYLGTAASPPLVGDTAETSYYAGWLSPGTTYYWRVVATNSFGSASSVTLSFTTGVPVPGLRFVAVPPCRVVDTRASGGPLTGGSSRSFAIPQSNCAIPATAQAYSFNVTAVPHGPLPFLTLWPTGQDQPGVSTLNSFEGEVVANAAIVPAGTNGAVSVYAAGLSDVILDINGYFDASVGPSSYSFYPVAPCRVADTRDSAGPFGGPEMTSVQSRDFAFPVSGCGMPFNG